MNKPLLSVIVPIYNVEKYIERCLDSIINQTYENIEIICISDGNKDNSNEIIKQKYLSDTRVRLVEKENGGLVSVRKIGIIEAKGEYIAHVDGDDWIESNMYDDLMKLMSKYDADIVTSGEIRDYGSYTVDSNEYAETGLYEGDKLKELKKNIIRTDVFYKTSLSVHQWNKIYKKSHIEPIQLDANDGIRFFEDAAVVYPAIYKAKRIVVSGRNYYHYCLREDSIGGIIKEDNRYRMQIVIDDIHRAFHKNGFEVENIEKQTEIVILYLLLLRDSSNTIRYDNGILYPFDKIDIDEKIAIYGSGKFGMVLKKYLTENLKCEYVEWVDSTGSNGAQKIEEVNLKKYDKIIVAALLYDVVEDIVRKLLSCGADSKKILRVNVFM